MSARHPAAYLRRSQEGGITKDDEVRALKALAVREGYNGSLEWFDDWGHSADESKDAQTELARLMADMRADKISTVLAGKMDRLARSVAVFARFAAVASEHNVRLVTVQEGDLSEKAVDDDPFRWGSRQFMVTMAEMELRTIKSRIKRAKAVQTKRGDTFGLPGYGYRVVHDPETGRVHHVRDNPCPADAVVEAYKEAGSIMGAGKLLQARGIPAPKGGEKWGQSTLAKIILREAPELLPRKSRTASRRTPTNHPFAQLIACTCGATMTPNGRRRQMYCPWGHRLGSIAHGTTTVPESTIRAWVEAELDHLELEGDTVETRERNEHRRAAVEARLEKVREDWYADRIDRKRWVAEQARAAADLDALDSTEKVMVELPPVDDLWNGSYPPATVSKILRSVFVRIDLDKNMIPVSATWRNPDLRQNCADPACTHCRRP